MPDISFINEAFEEASIGIILSSISSGKGPYWLKCYNGSYRIKVKREFVETIETLLHENCRPEEEFGVETTEALAALFQSEFDRAVISPFVRYPMVGFVAGDYAEFYLEYGGNIGDVRERGSFLIGDVEIWVSASSSLVWLLHTDPNDDNLCEILEYETIKLKGTSVETVEDDLCSAFYYLRSVAPSYYEGDLPRLLQLFDEDDVYTKEKYDEVNQRTFAKPDHPIPLRFFLEAEGSPFEIALLYYYKVIEYFFDLARRQQIKMLLRKFAGDEENLVAELQDRRPHRDEDYLCLVIDQAQNAHLWTTVSSSGFFDTAGKPSAARVKSLAAKIYKIRNEVAHGKVEPHLDLVVPSIIPTTILLKQRLVFRALAMAVLGHFSNVTVFPQKSA